jgi:translation initiation factor IF-1
VNRAPGLSPFHNLERQMLYPSERRSAVPHTMRAYHGGSMLGTLRPGDQVVIEPVPFTTIRPGDVVAFRPTIVDDEKIPIVHRVVATRPAGLLTQGDNNAQVDEELVTADRLLGRVTCVERGGRRRLVCGGRVGQLWIVYLRARRRAYNLAARLGRGLYQRLRVSGLMRRVWRPRITRVRLVNDYGTQVKYVCGGRTVARWWPHQNRFQCQKPYDLVIPRPDGAE